LPRAVRTAVPGGLSVGTGNSEYAACGADVSPQLKAGLQLRGFARKLDRPRSLPVVAASDSSAEGSSPPLPGKPHDWSQGPPQPPPKPRGYGIPMFKPSAGVPPRLAALKMSGGLQHAPFDDPGTPPAGTPIETDRPLPPWKVLRTHNGNLPVYECFRKHGTVATTMVRHFYGDVEHMRKALMVVCEAPVRIRAGNIEVQGLHSWKIKEWLLSLGM